MSRDRPLSTENRLQLLEAEVKQLKHQLLETIQTVRRIQVKLGLQDSLEGKVRSKGDFSKFIDNDD
jgi:hypothetical protein